MAAPAKEQKVANQSGHAFHFLFNHQQRSPIVIAFRYLVEGGRWHDDETAKAFEPNGVGGHNAVIHT